MTVDEASAFIAEQAERSFGELDQWFQIAIADRASDELLGDIGICRKAPGSLVEIGFTLAADAQGHGYASEACRAAMQGLFALPGVTEIEAIVDARNTGAIQLVKRLGMRLTRSEQAEFKGEMCTEHRFATCTSTDTPR